MESQWGQDQNGFYHLPELSILDDPYHHPGKGKLMPYYVFNPEQVMNVQFSVSRNGWLMSKSAGYTIYTLTSVGSSVHMPDPEDVANHYDGSRCMRKKWNHATYYGYYRRNKQEKWAECTDQSYWVAHYCAAHLSAHGVTNRGDNATGCDALANFHGICTTSQWKQLADASPNGPPLYKEIEAVFVASCVFMSCSLIVICIYFYCVCWNRSLAQTPVIPMEYK